MKEEYIREQAFKLGFSAIGFARAEPSRSSEAFNEWLANGYAADMQYLRRHAHLRSDPHHLAPQAKTVVVTGARYRSDESDCPISNYARGQDYHIVLKSKLSQLAAAIGNECGKESIGGVCIDSAPLPEREWAVRAGIGWIGKQGSVVNPDIGCCFFIGELLVNFEIEPSPEVPCQCRDCDLCVKACPTGAIMPGNLIDTRKCLAYLTIEHKGEINPAVAARLGGSVYGCDRCTRVCPWNRRNKTAVMPEFDVPPSAVPSLKELSRMDHPGFKKMFGGTPVERIGFERFQRNVRTALSNQNQ